MTWRQALECHLGNDVLHQWCKSITFLLFERMIQKGSSSAFSSSQCKHHWNALISYLSFSIWPLNPIKVVSIASLLSHEALFISVLFKIPFCLVFLLHALFLVTLFFSDFRTKVILFHFFHTFPPLPVSYTFKLFHCHLRLFCSHPLLFFNLHTPYFCHPFSPPFLSPDFLIFTSQSFYRCPSHSIQIKEYHCAI